MQCQTVLISNYRAGLSNRSWMLTVNIQARIVVPWDSIILSSMLNHKDALAKQITKRISPFYNVKADEKAWVRCKQQKLNKASI